MVSSGMLRRVDLVRTHVSEEPSAFFIRVTRIGELGAIQAATSNRRTLRRKSQKTPFFRVCISSNSMTHKTKDMITYMTPYVLCSRSA
jgi:hypothetical protein